MFNEATFREILLPSSPIIRIIIRDRNKYCLNLKEFNCVSQPYRSSLSYIKGRSDFQTKGLKKERKRERERETAKEYGC